MKTIEMLTDFANRLPNDVYINEQLKKQPAVVRAAFEDNDNEKLKMSISSQTFYATEVRVTIY